MRRFFVTGRMILLLTALVTAGASPSTATDYPNPGLLTSTLTLGRMLEDPTIRVVDIRPAASYRAGHIPGAVHLDPGALIDPASHSDADLHPLDALASLLGARGIGMENRVVLYDDRGGLDAARLFWLMELLGHTRVSLLNGGFPAWQREGWVVSTDTASAEPADFSVNLNPHRAASADWLTERHDDLSTTVIDVRPPETFSDGRFPWAAHIPWTQTLTEDGTMRPADALLDHFAAHGVTPDRAVAVFCQNDTAAAHTYWVLRLLGYAQVRSYDRSWAEWAVSSNTQNGAGG